MCIMLGTRDYFQKIRKRAIRIFDDILMTENSLDIQKFPPMKQIIFCRLSNVLMFFFVTKNVLTYCEKKIVQVIEKKLLKFETEG